MGGAVQVDALDGVAGEEGRQRLFGLRRSVHPQRLAEAVPRRGEAFLVGVGVLDDQPVQRLGIAADDAEADRAAIVLRVEAVVIEALGGQELLHRHRERVEV